MNFKNLLSISFLLFSIICSAQDYLDFARLNIGRANFEDVESTFDTDVTNLNFEALMPLPIKGDKLLLTGITVENTSLNLAANSDRENLTLTRINLGMKMNHSEKWTGTYMLLPRITSNFDGLNNAFQFGALALLEHQTSESLATRFGLYSSSENFGVIITPLVGLFYRSENKKFHIDAVLPIRAEINYALGEKVSIGTDLRTSVKSYALGNNDTYVQEESIRAAAYASYGLFQNNFLVRAKLGFDTTDYGVYDIDDTIGAQVLTFSLSNDDRTRLNNEFDSSLFFGLDLIYRIPFE